MVPKLSESRARKKKAINDPSEDPLRDLKENILGKNVCLSQIDLTSEHEEPMDEGGLMWDHGRWHRDDQEPGTQLIEFINVTNARTRIDAITPATDGRRTARDNPASGMRQDLAAKFVS